MLKVGPERVSSPQAVPQSAVDPGGQLAKRLLIKRLNVQRQQNAQQMQEMARAANRSIASSETSHFHAALDLDQIAGAIRLKSSQLQSQDMQLRPHAYRFSSVKAKSLAMELSDKTEAQLQDELADLIVALSATDKGNSTFENLSEQDALEKFLLLNQLIGRRGNSSHLQQVAEQALDQIEREHGDSVYAQINAAMALEQAQRQGGMQAAQARASSQEEQKAKKKSKRDFVKLYRDFIVGVDNLRQIFEFLCGRFEYEVIPDGINQIRSAIAFDLKSARSSMSPIHLNAVLNETRQLNCLVTMIDLIKEKFARFERQKYRGLPEQKQAFEGCVMATSGSGAFDDLIALAKEIKPTYLEGVLFLQELGEALRTLPDEVWSEDGGRMNTLATMARFCERTVDRGGF